MYRMLKQLRMFLKMTFKGFFKSLVMKTITLHTFIEGTIIKYKFTIRFVVKIYLIYVHSFYNVNQQ